MAGRLVRVRSLVIWTAVGLALCRSAFGQTSADGSIRGYVQDEQQGFLPGVTVTATSLAAPGAHIAVTDSKGYYRLLDMPPAEYTLTAELQGFAKFVRPNVVIRAGLNLGVDITLTVGTVTEVVQVKAETPMLESRNAVQAVNIGGEFQRSVPLSGRHNWADFMLLVPGTTSIDVAAGTFNLHGSDVSSHVIQIDGADMASVQQSSTTYLNFSTEVVNDVQVKRVAWTPRHHLDSVL